MDDRQRRHTAGSRKDPATRNAAAGHGGISAFPCTCSRTEWSCVFTRLWLPTQLLCGRRSRVWLAGALPHPVDGFTPQAKVNPKTMGTLNILAMRKAHPADRGGWRRSAVTKRAKTCTNQGDTNGAVQEGRELHGSRHRQRVPCGQSPHHVTYL